MARTKKKIVDMRSLSLTPPAPGSCIIPFLTIEEVLALFGGESFEAAFIERTSTELVVAACAERITLLHRVTRAITSIEIGPEVVYTSPHRFAVAWDPSGES